MNEMVTEERIAALVEEFYARARRDPLIGPVFNSAVLEWDKHLETIRAFWSNVLLGTHRYTGNPFGAHLHLTLKVEFFDRWLELFRQTATELLPPDQADKAMAMAVHMGDCLKHGLVDGVGNRVSLPLRKWRSADTSDPVRIEHDCSS